jgi:Rrf2 family protein
MFISQKCQYALRAVFELAKRRGHGPTKIAEIAGAQEIPLRFLEVILNQLRQSEFIGSARGRDGGYFLTRPPGQLTVGHVLRVIDPAFPAVGDRRIDDDTPTGEAVLRDLWKDVGDAISDVLDNTTFETLVRREGALRENLALSFMI